MGIAMRLTLLVAYLSSVLAVGCCSKDGNSIDYDFLTTFKGVTNFSSLLGSITTYGINPQADKSLGEVLVLIAEVLIALSVLAFGGMIAILLALASAGDPLIQILPAILPGPGESFPTLDEVVQFIYDILSPVVNPMLDQINPALAANVIDHVGIKSRAGILGGVLFVFLLLTNVVILVLLIRTHLRIRILGDSCGAK